MSVDNTIQMALQEMEPTLQESLLAMYWDGFNAGIDASSKIAEVIERRQWEGVGNPMLPTFDPVISKALKELKKIS